MTGQPIASIEPGAVDSEVADRAARRISDYLTNLATQTRTLLKPLAKSAVTPW